MPKKRQVNIRRSKALKLYWYHIRRYQRLTEHRYKIKRARKFFKTKTPQERRTKIRLLKRMVKREPFKKKVFKKVKKLWNCFWYSEIEDFSYAD